MVDESILHFITTRSGSFPAVGLDSWLVGAGCLEISVRGFISE